MKSVCISQSIGLLSLLLWTYANGDQICFDAISTSHKLANKNFFSKLTWEVINGTKKILDCLNEAKMNNKLTPPLCDHFQASIYDDDEPITILVKSLQRAHVMTAAMDIMLEDNVETDVVEIITDQCRIPLQSLIKKSRSLMSQMLERTKVPPLDKESEAETCKQACELVTYCKHQHCQTNPSKENQRCHINTCIKRTCEKLKTKNNCDRNHCQCEGLIVDGITQWYLALHLFKNTLNYIHSNWEFQSSRINLNQSMAELKLYSKENKKIRSNDELLPRPINPLTIKAILERLSYNP